MTTIRTMEDFTRVLREHPEWRDELRKQILTEQLLALPQRFEQHAEATSRRFADIDQRLEALVKHAEATDRRFEDIDQRLEALVKNAEAVVRRFEGMDQRFEGMDRRFEGMDRRFADIDRRLEALVKNAEATDLRLNSIEEQIAENTRLIHVNSRHIGEIKGVLMETKAADRAPLIADDMGLEWKRNLARREILALVGEAVRAGSAEGIPANHIRSLRNADLIMEAFDPSGRACWIVAEVSWTADERDTARAIRSAGYLARLTDAPVYAAVAAVRVDREAEDILTHESPRPHGAADTEKAFHALIDA